MSLAEQIKFQRQKQDLLKQSSTIKSNERNVLTKSQISNKSGGLTQSVTFKDPPEVSKESDEKEPVLNASKQLYLQAADFNKCKLTYLLLFFQPKRYY